MAITSLDFVIQKKGFRKLLPGNFGFTIFAIFWKKERLKNIYKSRPDTWSTISGLNENFAKLKITVKPFSKFPFKLDRFYAI